MNVCMVGVDNKRIGGMWTVAETYIKSESFNKVVNLAYIPTNTYGSAVSRVFAMLKGYGQLIGKLAFGKVDLVHIHMAEKGSTYRKGIAVWIAKAFRKKIVLQLHAGPFPAWYETRNGVSKWMIRSFFKKADMVLALGDFWKEQLGTLVDPKKIRVLYNGSYCPEANLYNPDGDKMLYLGVMKKAKGTFDLIRAMALIDDKLPKEITLWLCGTAEEEGIAELIRELGLEDRIKLPGWINKEQRLALFKEARMVIHPSYFEALSMTVIEAMCYGLPVITTKISTMPELLGENAPLVEPGDVEGLAALILKLSNDKEMRMEISESVYNRARTYFSTEQNISETLRLYREVLFKNEKACK